MATAVRILGNMMNTTTNTNSPIVSGARVRIEKGCNALGITKGATAVVKSAEPMGKEYGYSVRVVLYFLNSFMSGKTVVLWARHANRLNDAYVSLNNGDPTKKVEIRRA